MTKEKPAFAELQRAMANSFAKERKTAAEATARAAHLNAEFALTELWREVRKTLNEFRPRLM